MSLLRTYATSTILAATLLLLAAVTATAQPTPVLPGYSVSLFASGLSHPTGLLFRPAHNDLLVCQENANRVSRLDLATGAAVPFSVVAYPEHITVDLQGNVYVTTDNDNGPLTIFDSTGKAIDSMLIPGHPDGLAVDADDNVLSGQQHDKNNR